MTIKGISSIFPAGIRLKEAKFSVQPIASGSKLFLSYISKDLVTITALNTCC